MQKTETPVVSNNSAHRWTPDVPMVVPEINAEHFEVIKDQKKRLGTTRGFIAVKPNCSIQSCRSVFGGMERIQTERACCYNISGNFRSRKNIQRLAGNAGKYYSVYRRRKKRKASRSRLEFSEKWKMARS